MRAYLTCCVIASSAIVAPSCQSVTCGDGTVERSGVCAPADQSVSGAKCGPFTMQQGDTCVPQFDPTVCDPGTTEPSIDPATHVTTCIGTGGGGCGSPLPCPQPSDANHQTICGQIYDLETGQKYQAQNPTGAKCTTATADGPCSLRVDAFDALVFAANPQSAPKLQNGGVYIDDCGRYRVPDIKIPTGPFIGMGIDDADTAKMGPAGVTNSVGFSTATVGGTTVDGLNGYIAKKTTTDMWAPLGPSVATGFMVAIFFAHQAATDLSLQSGVQFTKNGSTIPASTTYFSATGTGRTTIDTNATSTGANGTALITGAVATEGPILSGTGGGLSASCKWAAHAGASLANIVFVQEFRPVNVLGMTCDR